MDNNFFQPRKLKFKAWNASTGLMMRLNAIDCVKGELVKKDHQLLQFTGLVDKQGEELYELDVMMIDGVRYCIVWDEKQNGWMMRNLLDQNVKILSQGSTEDAIRLWNYLESAAKQS